MTIQTRKPNLKQMATNTFTNSTDWLREADTIFKNSKQEVWLKNQGGFCVMQAMQNHKRLTGRKYSKCLVIGYYDPSINQWVVSEHLENDYKVWVQETKRLWGMN